MAQSMVISGSRDFAKVRNPWGVLGLLFLTLGIYHLFWWYYVNREMRDLGRARQVDLGQNPAMSLLAMWFGWYALGIPLVWTIVTTTRRVQESQRVAGVEPLSGWLAAALWIFTLGLGAFVYLQSELNKVWQAPGIAAPATLGPPTGTLAAGNADLDRLKQLTELRDSGSLSQEEFDAEKARLGITASQQQQRPSEQQ
jgi:hypothetical protein